MDTFSIPGVNLTQRIQNITPKQVREILKKLDYNKYYEHIPHVINVLNGKKAPVLSRQEEEHLRSLFKEIQLPFSKNCPQDRKNFLSYSYVLHKFSSIQYILNEDNLYIFQKILLIDAQLIFLY